MESKDFKIDSIIYQTWYKDNNFIIRMSDIDRIKMFNTNILFNENQVYYMIRQMESKVFSKIKRW